METNTKVVQRNGKVRFAQQKLEKSLFYKEALKQMQNPEIVAQIKRVIATSPSFTVTTSSQWHWIAGAFRGTSLERV